jgi:hypothetical protein
MAANSPEQCDCVCWPHDASTLVTQELCGDVVLHHVRPGQQAREELFDLGADWVYLNHGSYGATLRCIQHWTALVPVQ